MIWPWSKRTPARDRPDTNSARADLAHTRSKWPEVEAVVGEVREWHRRNHFAERIQASFQGDRK